MGIPRKSGAEGGQFAGEFEKIAPMPWHTITPEPDALGESPFWLDGHLHWVDIAGRALLRLRPGGAVQRWPLPSEPGCAAPVRGGGFVIALRDGIYRARGWGGALECVARLPYDPATQRANDGKCDALGRLWVGTVYEGSPRQPLAALYCVDLRAGAPRVDGVLHGAITANGLAWSPDGGTLYWTDTPSHAIRRWPCDEHGYPQGAGAVWVQFPGKPEGWQPGDPGYGGRPDGATVDAQGRYWCAMYEGGRVLQMAPGGEVLASHATPALCPTMPCLGGEGLRTLFVTTARKGRPAEELARLPASGHVLARQVEGAGLPVHACVVPG